MVRQIKEGPFVAIRKDCKGQTLYIPAFRLANGKVELSYGRCPTRASAVREIREGFGYTNFEKKVK